MSYNFVYISEQSVKLKSSEVHEKKTADDSTKKEFFKMQSHRWSEGQKGKNSIARTTKAINMNC